jgi:tetrahedral aminopeptidase
MDRLKEVLKLLSQTPGVAGYEQEVARLALNLFSGHATEVKTDKLGNVIAYKAGAGEKNPLKVMIAAHMDEIGFMVSSLEKGYLRVAPVGGFDYRTLVNQEVTVHGRRDLVGIFNSFSPYLSEKDEAGKGVELERLFVDTALSEEELSDVVRVGDLVTVYSDFLELEGDVVSGKALDDRAGVAILYACLQELEKLVHSSDVYAVATVQEEVGWRGAFTSAYKIVPDIGIAVDVTHGELPGVPKYDTFRLGKGPTIAFGPNIHPAIYERLEKTAQEHGIPSHKEIIPGGSGTDAMAMQISRAGLATGVVSIPLRYMHTSVETMNMKDLKNAGRLLAYFIRDLDASFREVLKCC